MKEISMHAPDSGYNYQDRQILELENQKQH